MAYICRDCGRVFDEPSTYQEYRGEFWGVPAYETFYVCPECESTDYDDESIVESEDDDFDDDFDDESEDDLEELE